MPESYDSLRAVAEAERFRARVAPDREIADDPTPVAGCDAQFTHLLAERRRLSAALDALAQEVFVPTPRWPGALEVRA